MALRLLAVHAHPDDESSKGAGTYARYVSAGAQVVVVSCTGGERGDIQNDQLVNRAMASRDIAGARRLEMAEAKNAIGCEHLWLGYEDSGLPDTSNPDNIEPLPANCFALIPLEISAEPLVRIIRRLRPQVLVTYDESGGYPHPDHIRTHEISMYAWAAASDPSRYPDAGEPWQISKVYYDRIFNGARIEAMYNYFAAADPQSPYRELLGEMRDWMSGRPNVTTTQVRVDDFYEHRDNALRAHASQVPPDSPFFFLPHDAQREAWPFDDFQLVTSQVESELPETDLFAGIIDDQESRA